MTRMGAGFIAGGIVLYLLGGLTQIGWFYLMDAVVWGLVVLSVFVPWWSLRSLSVERQVMLPLPYGRGHFTDSPREDESLAMRLRVRNHGRLTRHFLKIVDACPLEDPNSSPRVFLLPMIGARSTVDFSYVATCYRRGRYTASTVVLETAAPVGLFVRRRFLELPLNVTVYPHYYEMDGAPLVGETWADQGYGAKSRSAAEFYGSREYHHGDPLKFIHWRNTARLGQLVVKEFEEPSQVSVAIAFDTGREWGTGRESTLEYAIRVAASLAHRCSDSGQPISILAGPAPPLRAHWSDAIEYLAGLEVGSGPGLEELVARAEPGQGLVAVVPSHETGLGPTLARLARRRGRLVVVLLDGFSPKEESPAVHSTLSTGGVKLVRCPLGGLKDALDALAQALSTTEHQQASVR
jgi:uncharacterized protein (DUF58 family)